MPKVSVIVPVYNTEFYVERTIISLMEQTLDDVQFIIIDDGSKDNSFSIIKKVIARYPVRQIQTILISRENRGVAATRAQGMELALGDYVIHLDSDDWVEPNWLEAMYNHAVKEDADVVMCDFYSVFENRKDLFIQDKSIDNIECIKKLLLNKISNSNWDKMVRRSLFEKHRIIFQTGYDMGEDFLVTFQVFMKAERISHINKALYFYNQTNTNSLTKCHSSKSLNDLLSIAKLAEQYLHENGLSKLVYHELELFKLNVVSTFITYSLGDVEKINHAFSLYPSANKIIFSSKFKTLKVAYILKKMGLLFLYRDVIRILKWVQNLT